VTIASIAARVPRRRTRCLLALACGLLAAAEIWIKTGHRGGASDFDQVWYGATVLRQGGNPYRAIGPEGPIYWGWPLYYPLPAMLAVAPLAALPLHAARSLFAGTGVALLVYAITRDGLARLLVLASVPFLHAVQVAQWSPLLTALYFLPVLGWLVVVKPNIGAAMLAASPSPATIGVAVAGGALLLGLSFVVLPGWAVDWLDAVRRAPHVTAPVTRAGGPLLLLALLRWRRPEARLLAALSCVPQTPAFYEALPVLLVAGGVGELVVLVLLSDASYLVALLLAPGSTSVAESALLYGRLVNVFYYLPALVVVLRRRNDAPEVTAVGIPCCAPE
jgi:hypothetical protein